MIGQHLAGRQVLPARRNRAHIDAVGAQGIHANAIAEKGAARAPARRIDREYGDAHLWIATQETIEDFVGNAAFSRAAGTRDADYRHIARLYLPFLAQCREPGFVVETFLDRRNIGRYVQDVVGSRVRRWARCDTARLGTADQVPDHFNEPHLHTVVRVINTLDPVLHQFRYFIRRNRAAAATKNLDMRRPEFGQAIHHVLEKFHVAALVGTDCDAVGVFLDRRAHDIVHAAVMPEMDDLRSLRLDQAPHDVDRRVVAIEQGGGGNEAKRWLVGFARCLGQVVCGGAHGP